MSCYVLSPLARADLDDIWAYSAQRWGDDQAEAHLRMLQSAIVAAAAEPLRQPACDAIRAGYRRQRAGSHLIFYRLLADGIDVVRILHERMDVESRLAD